MDGQESEDQKQSTADMTAFVQNLLLQMKVSTVHEAITEIMIVDLAVHYVDGDTTRKRFQAMSESIVSKIDEMGTRIDELEQSINDLKTEMGAESSSPLAPSKVNPEETKPADGSA